MSKAIKSYPIDERKSVVTRRLREKKGGNGYHAAKDYEGRKGKEGGK